MMYASLLFATPLGTAFTYTVPQKLEGILTFGMRVIAPLGRRKATGYVIAVTDSYTGSFRLKEIERLIDKTPVFTPELYSLSCRMADLYLCSPGQALDMMIPSGRRESDSALFGGDEEDVRRIEHLSPDQTHALSILDGKNEGIFYLYGVTGSGKSEVYLRTAERIIASGRQVIYLVPEITLTHQLCQDVLSRFSGKVAVLHSALTPAQRLKYWHAIMAGEVDLVIGARSAVFAPCPSLGLIILDEEHENSYKSGNTPRYHARQIAQMRTSSEHALFLMGSATPSLEAWHMMTKDALCMIKMMHRVGQGAFPKMQIVNLLKEESGISTPLREAMTDSLSRKKGIILFLNRRGYNYYYHCRHCGEVISCPQCSVPLTYHKKQNRLVCHYCGYSEELHDVCPHCGSTDMQVSGFGTERVEEEVQKLYPNARLARLDTDVACEDRTKVQQILSSFKKGEIDILLGTQMVAKGLNFPTVDLVGVILADSTLTVPDFRAKERTFSLLLQVAGRAGRYAPDGKVIIQTYRAEDNAIQRAAENDLFDFYTEELKVRKELAFPPYTRLVNLTVRSKAEEKALALADALADAIQILIGKLEVKEACVSLIGVAPCVIEKKASSYRYHVLICAERIKPLLKVVKAALGFVPVPSGAYIEVDVDPLNLL